MRRFHLGDVLSITTSVLVSPRYMDGVYDLVKYLAGEQPEMDALPETIAACKDYLLNNHPEFTELDPASVKFENWRAWLNAQVFEFGEWVEVKRPLAGDLRSRAGEAD